MAGGNFGGGSGTSGDPYLVEDAADLDAVRLNLAAHYKQTQDIVLSGDWIPVGTVANQFTGNYNANNKRISGLKIETTGTTLYLGLFGLVNSAGAVENIFEISVDISYHAGSTAYTGSVAGYNAGTIKNCKAKGVMIGSNASTIGHYLGGVVGSNNAGVIEGCSSDVDVSNIIYNPTPTRHGGMCGGIAGYNNGAVRKCFNTGNISSSSSDRMPMSGGVVGWNQGSAATVKDCYNMGNVFCSFTRSDPVAGGLVGQIQTTGAKIENSYSIGVVSVNKGIAVGGLVGINTSETGLIVKSYYDSQTSGQSDTGKGEPKTTAEMKTRVTYENWDFPITWLISPFRNDGYPYLVWQEYIDQEHIPNYPPQSYIELNFTAGDSAAYPMGRFFIDRTQFAVGRETVSIQGRNSIGKYLKDQSFDERNYYPEAALKTQFERALLAAGITNYHVAVNNTPVGMEFPPNMDMLTGIQELLKLTPGWIIREDVGGKVVVGPRNDANFTQPSKYTFYRNRDIFSRESIRDDNDAYGRVCCHTADYSVRVYRPVPSALGWLPPAQKTFYVPVPDGTRSAEAASLAVELAEQMANSGEVETFVGPYRPHLIPGDQAEIIDADGPNLLGVITTVEHSWSKGGQGFITGITVDSGGKIGKPQLREFIDALSARQRSGAVKL